MVYCVILSCLCFPSVSAAEDARWGVPVVARADDVTGVRGGLRRA